ncbi:MAG: hypothetical protein ACE5Q3_10370 [Alphaproteobacteria bacterium]
MSSFAVGWLDLRAPFDAAARRTGRAKALASTFAAAVRGRDGRRVVRLLDLGTGTGNNVRELAPLLAGHQRWTVVDRDSSLLRGSKARYRDWARSLGWQAECDGSGLIISGPECRITLEPVRLNLATELGSLDLAVFDGLTGAALLDLVSSEWADRAIAAWAAFGRPALFALTVDGRLRWHPSHADDAWIGELFHRDLMADKGFGPALGVRAGAFAINRLTAAGYGVATAPTTWNVGTGDREMLNALVRFVETATKRQVPADQGRARAWLATRREQAAAGRLSVTVGHVDILASR